MVNYTGKSSVTITFQGAVTGKRYGNIATVKGNTILMPPGPQSRVYRNTDILKIEESSFEGKLPAVVRQTGRLPEDNYTLCISVLDENGNILTRQCEQFSISLPDQPQLVMPQNNDTVVFATPTFQWTPVITPPGVNVRYVIRICEILSGQLPVKALTANVPQFERILTGPTLIVYPSYALPFESGKTYVWQVQAIDANGQPAAANQGRSEIWIFTYKKSTPLIISTKPFYVTSTSVHGTLQYEWPGSTRPRHALANTLISLNIEYVFYPKGELPVILQKSQLPASTTDVGKEIATTTTNGNGGFSFSLSAPQGIPRISKDTSIQIPNRGAVKGDLYRVVRVIVHNAYYRSPDHDVSFNTGSNIDVGTIIAQARRWDLVVQVGIAGQSNNTMPSGSIAYLYQKKVFSAAPQDIGDLNLKPRPMWGSRTLIAKDSVRNGQVLFSYLVQNKIPGDEYLVFIQAPGMSQINYVDSLTVMYSGKPNKNLNIFYNDNSIFTDEVKNYQTGQVKISLKYISSVVTGHLTYSFSCPIIIQQSNNKSLNISPGQQPTNQTSNPLQIQNPANQLSNINPNQQPTNQTSNPLQIQNPANQLSNINPNQQPVNQPSNTLQIQKSTNQPSKITPNQQPTYQPSNVHLQPMMVPICKPLAGVRARLVLKYVLVLTDGTESVSTLASFPDANMELGVATSDPSGTVSFSVMVPTGFFDNLGTFGCVGTGIAYCKRVIRVIIDNPYYCSPNSDIELKPLNSQDFGTLCCQVRTFQLYLATRDGITDDPIPFLYVYLLRTKRPPTVPEDECPDYNDNISKMMYGGKVYNVIAKIETDTCHWIMFAGLVKNDSKNSQDYYFLLLKPDPKSNINYDTTYRIIQFDCHGEHAVFNDEYNQNTYIDTLICKLKPLPPYVSATVIRSDGGKPAPGALVELKNIDNNNSPNDIVKIGITDINGYVKLDNLPANPSGPDRELTINCPGFEVKKIDTIPRMPMGIKCDIPLISIDPAGSVYGEVIDETGEPVHAWVNVTGGASIETECFQQIKYMKGGKTEVGTMVAPGAAQLGQTKIVPATTPEVIKSGQTNIGPAVTLGPAQSGQTKIGTVVGQAVSQPLISKCPKYEFHLPAPKGKQIIHITADSKYLDADTTINITQENQNVGKLIIYKKLHRFQVIVKTIPKVYDDTASFALEGAQVDFLGLNNVSKTTDSYGSAYFVFESDAKEFTIQVKGPPDRDLETQFVTLTDSCSKTWRTVIVTLPIAGRVVGKVYVGKNRQPVEGAHVYMESQTTNEVARIETYTGPDGSFILRNVPLGNHTFSAAKGGSFTIGDSERVVVTDTGFGIYTNVPGSIQGGILRDIKIYQQQILISPQYSTATYTYNFKSIDSLRFLLTIYNNMDIDRLLGFPIEVTQLKQEGEKVSIWGQFIRLPSNNQFKINSSKCLRFSNIAIVPGNKVDSINIPIATPASGVVPVDDNMFEIDTIMQSFNGTVTARNGTLQVKDVNNTGSGIIRGKVAIYAGSFQTGGAVSFPHDSVVLMLPGTSSVNERMNVPVVAASESDLANVPDGFNVVDIKGNPLRYTLYTFDTSAVADPNASFVTNGLLKLATHLHTNIPTVSPSDLNLDIGIVSITPTSVQCNPKGDAISIQIEKWKLMSKNWSFDNHGLVLHNDTLKTGVVDIPVINDFPISPTDLETGSLQFDFSNMKLAGFVPMMITGNPFFVYNQSIGIDKQGHWSIMVVPKSGTEECARINSLPGMNAGDIISISDFYVLSNGETGITANQNAPAVTLYTVASFKPLQVVEYEDKIVIQGNLNLHIPNLGEQYTSIIYTRNPDQSIAFTFVPTRIEFDVNDVRITIPGDVSMQSLDKKGFLAQGNISQEGKFNFKMHFYRTVDSTSLWVGPGDSSNISSTGSSKLTGIVGNMFVTSDHWNNFYFEGDLTGTYGVSSHMKFNVSNEVIAEDQIFGIENLELPIGNITIMYDFTNHRFIGSVDFTKGIDWGTIRIYGCAEIVIDEGGWYFLSGAYVKIPGYEASAGLIIGNYEMTEHIKSVFANYSWVYLNKGDFPPIFPKVVKGMYTEGELAVPLIPPLIVDLVVVNAEAGIQIGADVRLGITFEHGATFGIGADLFGQAYAQLGASIIVACAYINVSVPVDLSFDGQISTDGTWFMDGDASIGLCGSVTVGWGICDSDCSWDTCDTDSWGGCKYIGLKSHIGSDGFSITPYIKEE